MKKLIIILILLVPCFLFAQGVRWSTDGNSYYVAESGEIFQFALPANKPSVFVSKSELTPPGQATSLEVVNYAFSSDQRQLLIYTNAKTVWRLKTRGDYWVMDLSTKAMKKIGKQRPASSLMFAKFSPDGTKVAYVSQQNLYVEDIASGSMKALTTDGNRKLINATFDWVYEEEFACRDGFQWSPDSKHISYWQIDANRIRDFYMINNTDSVYSKVIPVEYPTMGQPPSPAKIGVADIDNGKTVWLNIPGDPQQFYIPRIEWNSATEIFVQQLNRRQNESNIYNCSATSGQATLIHSEKDKAWVEIYSPWEDVYSLDFRHKFKWINSGKEFLWISEKGGWRQLYRIAKDGKKETLITKGNFDMIDIGLVDEPTNTLYFLASPVNATQKYLFKTTLDGKGKVEQVTPLAVGGDYNTNGTHDYDISPNGKYALHSFSNTHTQPLFELVSLPAHKALSEQESISHNFPAAQVESRTEFFKVKTEDGVEMDGWMVKPKNFDASKKYPILFFVYTEPWQANVKDNFGAADNPIFNGDLAQEGYIYVCLDNRGTPAPKGTDWRKCIYRKIGQLNIRDQALGAKEILKWPYVDADRVAVWGWSGGGSATLNLMFQYPEIYKTGIAVAAVTNLLTYDNVYEERFMGLPEESLQDIIAGSPLTYAKNLKGNLLYIHGTGDDNVHYANAEMLLNELVKYNKQFQFMAYPNRTHGIFEGEGTSLHLSTLYSNYLRKYCPPGPK